MEQVGFEKRQRDLNAALAKAQAAFPKIARDRTVKVETKSGGSFSYKYATLDGILSAVRPALAENGFAVVQLLGADDVSGRPLLRTELLHSGGGVLGAAFPLPTIPDDPQRFGSLLTYFRRYALTALLGIASEEDDDGARGKPKDPKPKPRAAVAKPDELVGAQVQRLFGTLRELESELGVPSRDWTSWTRVRVGVEGDEIATEEHWRRAVPLLQEEETKLRAELAKHGK